MTSKLCILIARTREALALALEETPCHLKGKKTVKTGRVCFDSSSEELEEIGLVRLPRAAARRLAFRTAMKSLALAIALAGVGVFLARVLLAGESWSMVRLAVGALLVVMGVAVVARMILSAVLRYRDSRIGHDRTRFVMVLGGVKRRIEVVLRAPPTRDRFGEPFPAEGAGCDVHDEDRCNGRSRAARCFGSRCRCAACLDSPA